LPKKFAVELLRYLNPRRYKLRKSVIEFLKNDINNIQSDEKIQILRYFENNPLQMLPYQFKEKYKPRNIKVFSESGGYKYIFRNGKKLYFPKDWKKSAIQSYYNGILIEQDKNSPHCYFDDDFMGGGGSLADIGAAEGVWALDNIDRAKKAYLFECDEIWIEALKKTFEPWKDKVVIINKYISDITESNKITIDDFFKDKEINFIKADIEGAEIKLLKGAKETLKQNDLKLALCAYHNQNDEQKLIDILESGGYVVKNSKGYIFFPFGEDCVLPHLRRGLIFAKKK
jgi:hypothetical protein